MADHERTELGAEGNGVVDDGIAAVAVVIGGGVGRQIRSELSVRAEGELVGADDEQLTGDATERTETDEPQLSAFAAKVAAEKAKIDEAAAAEKAREDKRRSDALSAKETKRQAVLDAVTDLVMAKSFEIEYARRDRTTLAELTNEVDRTLIADFLHEVKGQGALTVTLSESIAPVVAPAPVEVPVEQASSGFWRRKSAAKKSMAPESVVVQAEPADEPETSREVETFQAYRLGYVPRTELPKTGSGFVWNDGEPTPLLAYVCLNGDIRCLETELNDKGEFVPVTLDTRTQPLPLENGTRTPAMPADGRFEPAMNVSVETPHGTVVTRAALFVLSRNLSQNLLAQAVRAGATA